MDNSGESKLNLLICTQKVDKNDDVLGFFHDWLREFSLYCDKLTVICLQKGKYDLPSNVRVLSLGKEVKASKLSYLLKFYRYTWQERKNYDQIFVHMNPEYVVLGGVLWRLTRKTISLWYVHREINLKLRIAARLSHNIFTASQTSFRLKSKKVKIVGHGIDINKFKPSLESASSSHKFNIIYVGRISEIKNQLLLIEAINILVNEKNVKDIAVKFIGQAGNKSDEIYLDKLNQKITDCGLQNYIEFTGGIPNNLMPEVYAQADLALNLCPTGGVDKAVLEAMGSGNLVIALNKSFNDIIGSNLVLQKADVYELADKIQKIKHLDYESKCSLKKSFIKTVRDEFGLKQLIEKIVSQLN